MSPLCQCNIYDVRRLSLRLLVNTNHQPRESTNTHQTYTNTEAIKPKRANAIEMCVQRKQQKGTSSHGIEVQLKPGQQRGRGRGRAESTSLCIDFFIGPRLFYVTQRCQDVPERRIINLPTFHYGNVDPVICVSQDLSVFVSPLRLLSVRVARARFRLN